MATLMTEYGIFNDEGCIEAGFYKKLDAETAADKYIAEGDEVEVLAMCPWHEDHPANSCEACMATLPND